MLTASIVIPVLNEEENIISMHSSLSKELSEIVFEIIFVDDGSADKTWEKILELANGDEKTKGIKLSRCFGHQNAMKAGIDMALGKCVITIDGDTQQPTNLIGSLLQKWHEGYRIVNAVRTDEESQGFLKELSSKSFYALYNFFNKNNKLNSHISDFRLMDRQVVNILKNMSGHHIFIRGAIQWMGFEQAFVEYTLQKRRSGKSKFTIKKMIKLASAGITSGNIAPLRISLFIGVIFACLAFFYCLYAVYASIFTDWIITGWASVIVSVLLLSGIQLIILGIFGEYLGKLFIESKKRPSYIIKETSIMKSDYSKDSNIYI